MIGTSCCRIIGRGRSSGLPLLLVVIVVATATIASVVEVSVELAAGCRASTTPSTHHTPQYCNTVGCSVAAFGTTPPPPSPNRRRSFQCIKYDLRTITKKQNNKIVPTTFCVPSLSSSSLDAIPIARTAISDATVSSSSKNNNTNEKNSKKAQLLDLIIHQTPTGRATSRDVTRQILQLISQLNCTTRDTDVLQQLNGNWELLWTAQDPSQKESQLGGGNFIFLNPLEDQTYSNNPRTQKEGRSNPLLPMPIQNILERMGIIISSTSTTTTTTTPTTRQLSTQVIDIQTRTIRNIVSINLNPGSSNSKPSRRLSLTVTIQFTPVPMDLRRVIVKFNECRISIPHLRIDTTIPLGFIGPTGWLRTIYIDDTLRITRGHKGSVFVLTRPRRAATTTTTTV